MFFFNAARTRYTLPVFSARVYGHEHGPRTRVSKMTSLLTVDVFDIREHVSRTWVVCTGRKSDMLSPKLYGRLFSMLCKMRHY